MQHINLTPSKFTSLGIFWNGRGVRHFYSYYFTRRILHMWDGWIFTYNILLEEGSWKFPMTFQHLLIGRLTYTIRIQVMYQNLWFNYVNVPCFGRKVWMSYPETFRVLFRKNVCQVWTQRCKRKDAQQECDKGCKKSYFTDVVKGTMWSYLKPFISSGEAWYEEKTATNGTVEVSSSRQFHEILSVDFPKSRSCRDISKGFSGISGFWGEAGFCISVLGFHVRVASLCMFYELADHLFGMLLFRTNVYHVTVSKWHFL